MRPLAGMSKFEFRSVLRLSKAGGELDLAELEEGLGDTSPAGPGGRSHCCPAYITCSSQVQLTSHHPPVSSFLSLGIAWALPHGLGGVKARGGFAWPVP